MRKHNDHDIVDPITPDFPANVLSKVKAGTVGVPSVDKVVGYRHAQSRANNAEVKPQPNPRLEEISDPTLRRIEYLRAKSDRTLEEGLELQELELGLEKSKELNAGWTSDMVHNQQAQLRIKDDEAKRENGLPVYA